MDLNAFSNIEYGLYVVTSNDGTRDNGLIVNAVSQVASSPNRIAVSINKQNYSHDVIKNTGMMNLNCLSEDAPFSLFERFGFKSGKDTDKFAGCEAWRSPNGLLVLKDHINSFMSLKTDQYIDLGTHGLFICTAVEAKVISDTGTMTYAYYQENVKPKPQPKAKKGFICTLCGYVYEGDVLPPDFICPLCKHDISVFEPIK